MKSMIISIAVLFTLCAIGVFFAMQLTGDNGDILMQLSGTLGGCGVIGLYYLITTWIELRKYK